MSHDREERKRQERARAREQMGSLYVRREPQQAERWPRLVCSCGADAGSVDEVILCKHEENGR